MKIPIEFALCKQRWNRRLPACAIHTAGEIHSLGRASAGSEELLRNRVLAGRYCGRKKIMTVDHFHRCFSPEPIQTQRFIGVTPIEREFLLLWSRRISSPISLLSIGYFPWYSASVPFIVVVSSDADGRWKSVHYERGIIPLSCNQLSLKDVSVWD